MSDEAGLAAQDQGPRAAYVQDFKREHLMIHTTTAVSCTLTSTTVTNSLSLGAYRTDRLSLFLFVCLAFLLGGPMYLEGLSLFDGFCA